MARFSRLSAGLTVSAFAAGLSAAALAAEPFPAGVYSSQEGCPSTDIHAIGDPMLLSAQGLEAIEYSCEFARVDPVFGGHAWLIQAACQEPGFMFPEHFVVLAEGEDPQQPAELRMTSDDGPGSTETRFFRCE